MLLCHHQGGEWHSGFHTLGPHSGSTLTSGWTDPPLPPWTERSCPRSTAPMTRQPAPRWVTTRIQVRRVLPCVPGSHALDRPKSVAALYTQPQSPLPSSPPFISSATTCLCAVVGYSHGRVVKLVHLLRLAQLRLNRLRMHASHGDERGGSDGDWRPEHASASLS